MSKFKTSSKKHLFPTTNKYLQNSKHFKRIPNTRLCSCFEHSIPKKPNISNETTTNRPENPRSTKPLNPKPQITNETTTTNFQKNEMVRQVAVQAKKHVDRTLQRWRKRDLVVLAEAWTLVPEAPVRTEDPATELSSIVALAIDRAPRDFEYRLATATPCDHRRR